MSGAVRPRLLIRGYEDVRPPVVVVGMHRSGTSMLTGMLRHCGFHAGCAVDHLHESYYFRRINTRLLERAGATWTSLGPYLARHADPTFHAESCAQVRARLDDNFLEAFLGFPRPSAPFWRRVPPWGWKDPRTCVTLAVWKELFPAARWLHITRHPLAVAVSLRRREEKRQREGRKPVPASLDLDHNLRLWETHVAGALALRAEGERYLEVRYEDLVADATPGLAHIAAFCGLAPSRAQIEAAAGVADASRTQAHEEPEFAAWREPAAGLPFARQLGYG